MSFLVAYASTHGHTAKIAERIARVLRDGGVAVDQFARACAQLRAGVAVTG